MNNRKIYDYIYQYEYDQQKNMMLNNPKLFSKKSRISEIWTELLMFIALAILVTYSVLAAQGNALIKNIGLNVFLWVVFGLSLFWGIWRILMHIFKFLSMRYAKNNNDEKGYKWYKKYVIMTFDFDSLKPIEKLKDFQ